MTGEMKPDRLKGHSDDPREGRPNQGGRQDEQEALSVTAIIPGPRRGRGNTARPRRVRHDGPGLYRLYRQRFGTLCGRGTGYGGRSCTDGDTGTYADPSGQGRHCRGTGYTDGDTGAYADPPGGGRGPRSCSDSDTGNYSDPIGQGRRC